MICYLCFCSPSGKLVQIEYALAAVAAGAPSVGIKGAVTILKQKVVPLFDQLVANKLFL
jgi:20S proteasome subunit alpha 2